MGPLPPVAKSRPSSEKASAASPSCRHSRTTWPLAVSISRTVLFGPTQASTLPPGARARVRPGGAGEPPPFGCRGHAPEANGRGGTLRRTERRQDAPVRRPGHGPNRVTVLRQRGHDAARGQVPQDDGRQVATGSGQDLTV